MSHDPDKSKVLCAVASGTVWGLRLLAVLVVAAIVVCVVYGAYSQWNTSAVIRGLVLLLALVAAYAIIIGVCMGLESLYKRADHYRRNC